MVNVENVATSPSHWGIFPLSHSHQSWWVSRVPTGQHTGPLYGSPHSLPGTTAARLRLRRPLKLTTGIMIPRIPPISTYYFFGTEKRKEFVVIYLLVLISTYWSLFSLLIMSWEFISTSRFLWVSIEFFATNTTLRQHFETFKDLSCVSTTAINRRNNAWDAHPSVACICLHVYWVYWLIYIYIHNYIIYIYT